jgi:NADH-quinone oxidoreductase subunit L
MPFSSALFLGAGSVIIAMHHEQDIFSMGGLSQNKPVTTWTIVIASLLLLAIPWQAVWSKDEILLAALRHDPTVSLAIGLIVAFMTAFLYVR